MIDSTNKIIPQKNNKKNNQPPRHQMSKAYMCPGQIVPLTIFYFSNDSEIKTSESPQNVVFSCDHSFSQ